MQTATDFLNDYFCDRTKLLHGSVDAWETHITRFFSPGYRPYDRQKAVAQSEAERVTSMAGSDEAPEIITSGCTGGLWRARYRLRKADDLWLVTSMEMECGICRGSGKARNGTDDCRLCKGKGWTLVGERLAME